MPCGMPDKRSVYSELTEGIRGKMILPSLPKGKKGEKHRITTSKDYRRSTSKIWIKLICIMTLRGY